MFLLAFIIAFKFIFSLNANFSLRTDLKSKLKPLNYELRGFKIVKRFWRLI